jgi:hypothetical protein
MRLCVGIRRDKTGTAMPCPYWVFSAPAKLVARITLHRQECLCYRSLIFWGIPEIASRLI